MSGIRWQRSRNSQTSFNDTKDTQPVRTRRVETIVPREDSFHHTNYEPGNCVCQIDIAPDGTALLIEQQEKLHAVF